MGVCAFVASGVNFDVDEYVRDTSFEVLCVFHKGDPRSRSDPEKRPRPDSGFIAVVSHDDFPHLLDQVGEGLDFLNTHEKEFERLKGLGVDFMALDFRVPQQREDSKVHSVPPELVQAMGRFHMGLVFSVEVLEDDRRPRRWSNPRRR